jgi:hypothetical protein
VRVPGGLIDGERAYGSAGLLGRIQSAHAASLLTVITPAAAPAKARPRALRSTFNKMMVSVMVLASVGTLASGTLASFNATTTNANNTFQTGTIALSDNVAAQTCLSYGVLNAQNQFTNNNANAACNSVAFAAAAKPGDAAATANFTLKNVGSLPGTTLTVAGSACVTTNNAETFHGAGDLCVQLVIAVQEMDNAFAVNKQCVYPTTAVNCPLTTAIGTFQTASPVTAGFTAGLAKSGAAGDTRYFQVLIQLPAASANSFQGRVATFSITWELDQ